MKSDDPEIARLLGGKRGPSVLEKEAQWKRIARRVKAERHPRLAPLQRWILAFSLAAAVGAVLLLIRPRAVDEGGAPDEFAARGDGSRLEFRCAPAPCAPGSRLLLRVAPPQGQPYVAVFARRPDGTVLWYLPAAGETMAPAPADWLDRVAFLDERHPPGRYGLYAAFAARPLDREQLKKELGDALLSTGTVTLVETELTVGAAP